MGTKDTIGIPKDENYCTPQMAWELKHPYIMVRRCELQFIEQNLENGKTFRALDIVRGLLARGQKDGD